MPPTLLEVGMLCACIAGASYFGVAVLPHRIVAEEDRLTRIADEERVLAATEKSAGMLWTIRRIQTGNAAAMTGAVPRSDDLVSVRYDGIDAATCTLVAESIPDLKLERFSMNGQPRDPSRRPMDCRSDDLQHDPNGPLNPAAPIRSPRNDMEFWMRQSP